METIQELNADYSLRATVETASMKWETSEAAGVLPKCLEMVNAKPASVTIIVQYQAVDAAHALKRCAGVSNHKACLGLFILKPLLWYQSQK